VLEIGGYSFWQARAHTASAALGKAGLINMSAKRTSAAGFMTKVYTLFPDFCAPALRKTRRFRWPRVFVRTTYSGVEWRQRSSLKCTRCCPSFRVTRCGRHRGDRLDDQQGDIQAIGGVKKKLRIFRRVPHPGVTEARGVMIRHPTWKT